jgi:iron complex outermembrane receptor protein
VSCRLRLFAGTVVGTVVGSFVCFFLWISTAGFAAELLPAMIVTATRTPIALEDAPAPVEVVTRADMEARGVRDLDAAVSTATGVFVRPGRGGGNVVQSITLHGVPEEKRSLILLDGQVLNGGYSGALNLTGLSTDLLDRVEIMQGPASALYGGNAMGGVVHYVTRLPDGPEATLKMGYGDAAHAGQAPRGTRWLSLTGGNKLDSGLQFLAGFSGRATQGYASELAVTTTAPTAGITGATTTTTNKGVTAYLIGDKGDNAWAQYSVNLRAELPLENGRRLSAAFLRQGYAYDFGDPHSSLRSATGATVLNYGTVTQSNFNASYGGFLRDLWKIGLETPVWGGKLKIDFAYATTPDNWYTTTGTTAATTTTGGPGRITFGKEASASADAQWSIALGTHQLTLGTALRRENASNNEKDLANWKSASSTGADVSKTQGTAETFALFAQDEWQLATRTSLWLGARFDHWRTFDGYTWNSLVAAPNNVALNHAARSANAISPKLAITHRVAPEFALRASVGRAFRPPSVYELYRISRIVATTYMYNAQLSPETMTSADVGVDVRPWSGANINLNAFKNRFVDLIYTAGSGTTRNRVNAGLAESQGVQFGFKQAFSDGVHGFINATQQSSVVKENTVSPTSVGKEITWMPRRLANVGVDAAVGAWQMSGTVRHATRQFSTDDNTDTATGVYSSYDGYTVADARIAYQLPGRAKLGLAIENLTDKKYFSYYPAAGRSWSVDLTVPF